MTSLKINDVTNVYDLVLTYLSPIKTKFHKKRDHSTLPSLQLTMTSLELGHAFMVLSLFYKPCNNQNWENSKRAYTFFILMVKMKPLKLGHMKTIAGLISTSVSSMKDKIANQYALLFPCRCETMKYKSRD